ncbi:NAD(P)-dependent dehydrogenase, short-chain alcohol dehydrogenase family [Cyclobacterium lianum]|uniref:NAD(P)-dependent dehydrogenase, short-chain alcohol dehydrogenase family n=1 Tax=Cyclobacterium lianum TaxID=388280 RepID=A0A1M7MGX8_9BACT|nr:glucose 1-dehydrogenase [Cyclobacterium lianum]SHM90100.1 NAD(P)-dependent dehydrogenase, short-chain alcohol dehydrogenase family [Cyclobacterium lianum]
MEQLLKGKTAIITGASSGIGKSTAILLAKNGANIVVADIDEKQGKTVVEKLKSHEGEAIFVKVDTSSAEEVSQMVKTTMDEFGRLDIAVNNAGVGGESALIEEYSVESWDETIAINLSGVFYGMKYQIPAMLENGDGVIINMASILGQVGFASSCAYVAAKHGIVGLTKNGALEYAKQGIRVNAIGPGFIKTPLLEDNLDEEQMEQITALHPQGRLGKPDEISELVLWLASEKSSFVNGAYLPADGGYLAQ